MWPNQPGDLVRHITKGDIRPLMQHNALMTPGAGWYGDGGSNSLQLGQSQKKGAFSPHRTASKKPNGKMKRPSQQRPPSAPLLSNSSSKPVRPRTASGLPHAASAAQFAAGHTLGGSLQQPKRAAKLRMSASASQAELTRLKRTTSGGALPPRLADDLLEGPVVLGGAEYERRTGPSSLTFGQSNTWPANSRRPSTGKPLRHAASQQMLQSPYSQPPLARQNPQPNRGTHNRIDKQNNQNGVNQPEPIQGREKRSAFCHGNTSGQVCRMSSSEK